MRAPGLRAACRRANTAWGWSSCPSIRHERILCEGILEKIASEEGLTRAGLARYARQRQHHRPPGAHLATLYRADFHQARPGHGPGRAGAQALRRAQARRERRRRVRLQGEGLLLPALALLAHHCLQGPAAGAADHRLLQGAARRRSDQRAVPGAPALLDQYVSELAAGASLSLRLPQRRDQYAARQRQLDARAAVRAGLAALRRRHQEAPAHHHPRRQRFRHARQRRGTADPGRPQPAARDGHADPRGLGRTIPPCPRTSRRSTNITPR